MPELVSLGECMIEFFSDDSLETAEQFRRAYGGDTLNLLVAARRLGTEAGYITRVAEDAFGRYLLNGWEREGIDTRQVQRGGAFNGVYFIATRENGEREFTYYRKGSAASELQPSDLDGLDFSAIRAFHTSGITQAISPSARETALRGLSQAKAAGCLTSFDLNFRPRLWSAAEARTALEEALPHVEVCFAGIPDDTVAVLNEEEMKSAAGLLHGMGPRVVVLKQGIEGAWVSENGRLTHIPAQIFGPAVDTSGAGDAFAGGFLHGLMAGHPLSEAGRLGAACAGLKVLGRGAVASMPSGEAVRQALQSWGNDGKAMMGNE